MALFYTYSGNVYGTASAGQTTFALTSSAGRNIPYLLPAHIHVSTSVDDQQTWVALARPADWNFDAQGTSVVLASPLPVATELRVQRITPTDEPFVDFQASSLLTAEQLNEGEEFSLYVDQELRDAVAIDLAGALIYKGTVDLTVDNAPLGPIAGWTLYNTGAGVVIQGGTPGWDGIVGTTVEGGEQVIFNGTQWEIAPERPDGVVVVNSTAPITVDSTDPVRPVIGLPDATGATSGAMSAADKAKLDIISTDALWTRTGTALSPVNAGDDVNIGGTKISLEADGTIRGKVAVIDRDAAGTVTLLDLKQQGAHKFAFTNEALYIGDKPPSSGGSPNISLSANGLLDTQRIAASSTPIARFKGMIDGSTERGRIEFYGAGSASFAGGGCEIDGAGRIKVKRTDGNDSGYAFWVQKADDSDAVVIKGDGSATFAGPSEFDGGISVLKSLSDPVTTNGLRIFNGGAGSVLVSADGAPGTSTSTAYQTNLAGNRYYSVRYDGTTSIGRDGSGNPKISLNSDGSASFATDASGTADTFIVSASQTGVYQGQITYDSNAGLSGYAVDFAGQTPVPVKWKLSRDGSATFAGAITSAFIAGTGYRNLNASAAGTITTGSSDERLKENISSLGSTVDRIKSLNPVTYQWKNREEAGDDFYVGFIAQEMEKVFPELTYENADGMKGVSYAELVSPLTKALQESIARIEALEARLVAAGIA